MEQAQRFHQFHQPPFKLFLNRSFGTVGMMLAVRFFSALTGIDLPAAAAELAHERAPGRARRGGNGWLPIIRAYRSLNRMVGKTQRKECQ